MPQLRYAILELTRRCNFRCAHCAAGAGRVRSEELELPDWLRVVDDLAALGCRSIDLMGGEVLLSPLLEPVGRALQERGAGWGILTNGWLLDEARAAALVAAGCRGIGVSLDGASAGRHDAIRGRKGSFERTLRALQVVAGLDLTPQNKAVLTSVSRRNVDELEAIGELVAERFPGFRWQINLTSAEAPRLDPEQRLDDAGVMQVARFLDRVRRERRWPVIVTGAHDLGYFADYLDLHEHEWNGCPAGIHHIGVQSDGLVKGCLALDESFGLGNVRQSGLRGIWEDDALLRAYREFDVEHLGEACRGCVWGSLCRGGCRACSSAAGNKSRAAPHCLWRMSGREERLATRRTIFAPASPVPYLVATEEADPANEPVPTAPLEQPWEVPLRSVCVELTLRCNMRCVHCGSTAGRGRKDELGVGDFETLFIDISTLGGERVVLLGGEPLLHPDWEEVAIIARGCALPSMLITNGLLISEEKARLMVELGISHVGVSVDGGRPATHDQIRGVPGSHAKALTAIGRLQQAGLPVTVITTLCRLNLGELVTMRDLLLDKGLVWQIQAANGTGERFRAELMLKPAELLQVARFIEQTRAEIPKERLAVAAGHNIGHYARSVHDYGTRGTWRGCPGGITSLGICSDGSVKGCLSMSSQEAQGNIRETPLYDLWRDPRRFARNRFYAPGRLSGGCGQCPHGAVCKAGCPEMARTGSGDVWDNPFCLRRAEEQAAGQ